MRSIPKNPLALLLILAGVKLLIHLLTNGQYGFHRDELYYIVGGFHPDFGYVDHPPLTPLLARLAVELFGPSVAGLRLFPALVGASIVLLTGILTRQLGGDRFAQGLAALCVILSPLYLLTNTLFQTVTFDQLVWVLSTVLVMHLVKTGNHNTWLAIGFVIGIGLQIKHTALLFGFGLVIALLLTAQRKQFASTWPWLGGLVALLIFLPNLIWQSVNDWPTLEFIRNNNANVQSASSRIEFLALQIIFLGIPAFPIAVAGLLRLFRSRSEAMRLLGWLYLSIMLLLLVVGGKPYYPAPLYPILYASGAIVVTEQLRQRKWNRLRPVLIGALLAITLPFVPLVLPVLPPPTFAAYQAYYPQNDFAEMFGWEELVEAVQGVYAQLPPDEQDKSTILTSNYGSAAAIDLLGASRGLPNAHSGHNTYYFWGPGDAPVEAIIAVGFQRTDLEGNCAEVQEAAVVSNRFSIDNEEAGRPIYLCQQPNVTLQEIWPQLKHFQ